MFLLSLVPITGAHAEEIYYVSDDALTVPATNCHYVGIRVMFQDEVGTATASYGSQVITLVPDPNDSKALWSGSYPLIPVNGGEVKIQVTGGSDRAAGRHTCHFDDSRGGTPGDMVAGLKANGAKYGGDINDFFGEPRPTHDYPANPELNIFNGMSAGEVTERSCARNYPTMSVQECVELFGYTYGKYADVSDYGQYYQNTQSQLATEFGTTDGAVYPADDGSNQYHNPPSSNQQTPNPADASHTAGTNATVSGSPTVPTVIADAQTRTVTNQPNASGLISANHTETIVTQGNFEVAKFGVPQGVRVLRSQDPSMRCVSPYPDKNGQPARALGFYFENEKIVCLGTNADDEIYQHEVAHAWWYADNIATSYNQIISDVPVVQAGSASVNVNEETFASCVSLELVGRASYFDNQPQTFNKAHCEVEGIPPLVDSVVNKIRNG